MKLTKSNIETKVKAPTDKDQVFYRDDELKGFALRVTASGTMSFVVEKVVNNRVKRITLGKYSDALPAEKKSKRMHQTTLGEVMTDYLHTRKGLKPKTIYDYQRVVNIAFASWKDKPLTSISKDKVEKQHSKTGQDHGEAYANLAMRVLRALFNFAAGKYEDSEGRSLIIDNPVKRLSQTRAWYRIERRQTFIKAHELAPWYQGIQALENEILRDYLLLIVFTGLRRQEAAKLRRDHVDFRARTLTITDTKNHEAHTLPLSDYLLDLLQRRLESTTNNFVFPELAQAVTSLNPANKYLKSSHLLASPSPCMI